MEDKNGYALNSAQKRHLLSSCEYIDRLLSDIEGILAAAASKSPLLKYRCDVSPAQRKVILDYITRIRAQIVRVLESQDIPLPGARLSSVHTIRVFLMTADIAIDELSPQYMRGYGSIPEAAIPELNGIVGELHGVVEKTYLYLAQGLGQDLQYRLAKLDRTSDEINVLRVLERVITEQGLVEYRSTLSMIVERLEAKCFEIAIFGRVNAGKSSLLNHILQSDVLPVGVNPITAVPTRITYGTSPKVTVRFADRNAENFEIGQLAEFATEQHNPANMKHVTRITVQMPSPRLQNGVIFVDTPGLGSLAGAGAAETLSYLPRCDLGVFLVDAGSTLAEEDLTTIRALYESGIPARVLLSKADLLSDEDRKRSFDYISDQVASHLGLRLAVHPVSIRGEQSQTLDRWFDDEILPLFGQHQELARQSMKRKIGSLREAVASSLRMKLERSLQRRPNETSLSYGAEAALRRAAGKFAEVRSACEQTLEEIGYLDDPAFAQAASELVDQWARKISREEKPHELVASSLNQMCERVISTLKSHLDTLAGELADILTRTAETLDFQHSLPEDEIAATVKEMPRLDLGSLALDLRPPLVLALGRRLASRYVERKLKSHTGVFVSEGLRSYKRILWDWTQRTLADMERRFNAYADTYRAQLERLLGNQTMSPQEREGIQRALADLTPEGILNTAGSMDVKLGREKTDWGRLERTLE